MGQSSRRNHSFPECPAAVGAASPKRAAATVIMTVALFVQACAPSFDPEVSCNFVLNSQGQRVSWGGNVPVDIYLDASVPAQFHEPIRRAAESWNQMEGRTLLKIRTESNPGSARPERDGFNKLYFMSTWESDRPAKEQARTTIYWSGPQIQETDIRINAQNFQFFIDETDRTYDKVHLESLVLHELGHALGLAHNDSWLSVMQTILGYGQIRATISDPEKTSMSCEY
jgi:hypothetical protein